MRECKTMYFCVRWMYSGINTKLSSFTCHLVLCFREMQECNGLLLSVYRERLARALVLRIIPLYLHEQRKEWHVLTSQKYPSC